MTKVLLVAGEASGDQHAATLIRQTQKTSEHPIDFFGIGGDECQQAGMRIIQDYRALNVMGITAVITKIPSIIYCYRLIKRSLEQQKPNCLVLVDFAGFNLKVAKLAKRFGIPVFYYIPPKVWAWKSKRIKLIQRYVDHVACIFPFERDIYEKHQVSCSIVPNPVVEQLSQLASSTQAEKTKSKSWTIALVPGSRPNEIKYCLPILLNAAKEINMEHTTSIRWIMPLAPTLELQTIKKTLDQYQLSLDLIPSEQRYQAYQDADIALATSGTVTLELSLLNTPMIVIYRMSWFTQWLAERWVKIPFVSLCNILLQKPTVTELIRLKDANSTQLALACNRLLASEPLRKQQQQDFSTLKAILDPDQYPNVGQCLKQFIDRECYL